MIRVAKTRPIHPREKGSAYHTETTLPFGNICSKVPKGRFVDSFILFVHGPKDRSSQGVVLMLISDIQIGCHSIEKTLQLLESKKQILEKNSLICRFHKSVCFRSSQCTYNYVEMYKKYVRV